VFSAQTLDRQDRPQGQSEMLVHARLQTISMAPRLTGTQLGIAPGKSAGSPQSLSLTHEAVQYW
jgi:hypothetical protein